jgi:hypothetical protein
MAERRACHPAEVKPVWLAAVILTFKARVNLLTLDIVQKLRYKNCDMQKAGK